MSICDIPQGNDRDILVKISSDGVPVDISGDTVNFIMKTNRNDLDVDAVFNITNGVGDHDVTTGETTFTLDSATTGLLSIANYFYEITHTSATNDVTTLISDRVKIVDTIRDPV